MEILENFSFKNVNSTFLYPFNLKQGLLTFSIILLFYFMTFLSSSRLYVALSLSVNSHGKAVVESVSVGRTLRISTRV